MVTQAAVCVYVYTIYVGVAKERPICGKDAITPNLEAKVEECGEKVRINGIRAARRI